MSIAVEALAGAPVAAVGIAAEPLHKVPPSRRQIAKPDNPAAPEPR